MQKQPVSPSCRRAAKLLKISGARFSPELVKYIGSAEVSKKPRQPNTQLRLSPVEDQQKITRVTRRSRITGKAVLNEFRWGTRRKKKNGSPKAPVKKKSGGRSEFHSKGELDIAPLVRKSEGSGCTATRRSFFGLNRCNRTCAWITGIHCRSCQESAISGIGGRGNYVEIVMIQDVIELTPELQFYALG